MRKEIETPCLPASFPLPGLSLKYSKENHFSTCDAGMEQYFFDIVNPLLAFNILSILNTFLLLFSGGWMDWWGEAVVREKLRVRLLRVIKGHGNSHNRLTCAITGSMGSYICSNWWNIVPFIADRMHDSMALL